MNDPKHHTASDPQKQPPRRAPYDIDLDEALARQPEWLRGELEGLKPHADRILEALKHDDNRALFMRDPAALLRKIDIPISGPFKNRLRADASAPDISRPVCVTLANGQSIRPKLRINFTK